MTYGDPSNADYPSNDGYPPRSGSGRARVPAPTSDYDDGYGSYGGDEHPAPRHPATGSASARASVPGPSTGRASVGGDAPTGRASVGSASVPDGRASVRSGGGYDDYYDYESPSERGANSTGRATVGRAAVGAAPVSPAAGRASVGRARVGTDDDPDFDFDAPDGPPPRRGGRGPGGRGPNGPDDGGDGAGGAPKKRKNHKKRNWILSSVAVFIMLSGLVVVFGAYEFAGVPEPVDFTPPQSTTVFYSDGKTQMAKFGDQNRTIVTGDQIADTMKWSVVATEDMTFYSNSGVSFRGIARAAWNNLKGGDTQGGSTISQQYMRQTLTTDPSQRNYKVKIQEALGAIKLDEKYSKDKIMEMYLNVIYFGRGTYGVEAAAQSYFGKSAKDLTYPEAMVLSGVIKDPGGAFDPTIHKDAAVDRWNYTKKNLIALGKVSKAEADSWTYPDNVKKYDVNNDRGSFGKDTYTGLAVHHVMDELSHMKDAQGKAKFPDLQGGGYKIVTTINKTFQDQVFNLASLQGNNSQLKATAKNPEKLQTGVVSIDPNTGEVLAYYGGDRGDGFDYAGIYRDPVLNKNQDGTDDDSWSGSGHPPGSTMKIYTLGAAIKQGISINSFWLGPKEREFPAEGRKKGTDAGPVHNAGASCPEGCTLVKALQASMNTVFYAVGERVKPENVVNMAHAMGVNHIWDNDRKRHDLDPANLNVGAEVAPSFISTEVAIGQFPITVVDHANGVATIAAGGVYRPAHFVKSVEGNGIKYTAPLVTKPLADENVLTTQQSADLRYAMEQVMAPDAGNNYVNLRPNGFDTGGKSGTWELPKSTHNGDAWFVGFTPKLATAVWVGNKDNPAAIYTTAGKDIAGANIPGNLFEKVMQAGLKAVGQTKSEKIQVPGSFTGDTAGGEIATPSPTAPSPGPSNSDMPCQNPLLCPTPSNSGPGKPSKSATPSPSQSSKAGPGH